MRFFFLIITIMIGLGILTYVAKQSISLKAIPSIQDFLASTTPDGTNSLNNNSSSTSITLTKDAVLYDSNFSTTTLKTPKGVLKVFVAKNPTTRQQGLSGNPGLEADQGMLFIFPTLEKRGFWMKDMNFSIDIVWMDRYKKIVGVTPNISPETYPKTFPSPGEVQFVLEVNAGSAEKFGLVEGKYVSF